MPTHDRDNNLEFIREVLVNLVRREETDLSQRQLAVLLTCYLETEAQTVRGLAAELKISKPAVTRALDRLAEFDLIRRKVDPLDRRSVLVQRTASGLNYLRKMREEIEAARAASEPRPGTEGKVGTRRRAQTAPAS